MSPGSTVHVGEAPAHETRVSVIDYSKETIEELQIKSIDELLKYKESDSVTWVIVEGLAIVNIVERIGELFGVHQLVVEDILNTHQRPKFEEHENQLFIVLKCLRHTGKSDFSVNYEQISLLVLRNLVFVFKEKSGDLFRPVQERLQNSKGRLRALGADYLAYAILDTVVDQNFVLIDSLDDAITSLEDSLLASDPTQDTLKTIQCLKREIVGIRRYVSPVRDLMSGILRSESELIDERTHIYLRDVSDHVLRIIESIEVYREILTGLLDIYISSVSNKMNEVMKVLTVFASIFIPLTFIAGIYGMNFQYMPELQWKWAYPTLWIAFITIPLVFLAYFKRKKWL